jgi:hypothetical protein
MQAARAVRTVIKAVINIFEQRGFEFGIVHMRTIARVACGALVDISYSVGGHRRLYKKSNLQS